MASQVIHLATTSANYDITIGTDLLSTLQDRLNGLMRGKSFRLFLITSPNIWELWSGKVLASFSASSAPTVLFLEEGEKHKRLSAIEDLAEKLAAAGADRDALLLAFGGGVIGDVTGFLAAIYMRGVPYVQIPSTLLAQVDSSLGGKTGVNLAAGKNLVGAFHHPAAVLADIDLLATLPDRELLAGMQESVKAAIIQDAKLFDYLEQNANLLEGKNSEALAKVIARSVQIKADVVMADERESNLRMILNFGHTIGHAIEAATGYTQLLHGEAVAWGSLAALHVGLTRGTIAAAEFKRMESLILAFGPLPRFHATAAHLVALSAADKKNRSGRRAFVLPTGIGSVTVVHDVSDAELLQATESMLKTMQLS